MTSNQEDINKLVSRINIYVMPEYEDKRTIGIGMECTWEDEKIVAAGYYDEAY